MYSGEPVPVPDVKGKIIYKKKGNSTYVMFQYDSRYLSERRYTIPQRAVIGKLCDEGGDMMYPNGNYGKYFGDGAAAPGSAVKGTRARKPVKSDVAGVTPRAEKFAGKAVGAPGRREILKAGAFAALKDIAKRTGLCDVLEESFGSASGALLDLAFFYVLCEKNDGEYFGDYAEEHPLMSEESGFRLSGMRDLRDAVGEEKTEAFMRERAKLFKGSCPYIMLLPCGAGRDSMAGREMADAKKMGTLKNMDLYAAVDGDTGEPIYISYMKDYLSSEEKQKHIRHLNRELGFTDTVYFQPYGTFSKRFLKEMDRCGADYFLMADTYSEYVREAVLSVRDVFDGPSADCVGDGIYAAVTANKISKDDFTERYVHVFYSERDTREDLARLHADMDEAEGALVGLVGRKTDIGKTYRKLFSPVYDGEDRLTAVIAKSDGLSRAEALCGYSCVITTLDEKSRDIYAKARKFADAGRYYVSDKAFFRNESPESTEGENGMRALVGFIASILSSHIRGAIADAGSDADTDEVLSALDMIYICPGEGGKDRVIYAGGPRQRDICGAFPLDDTDILYLCGRQ